ncbi:transposase [Pseudarthrobacter sp. R1]|uniref:transposase n=1 Tax=Pseudarthrobacter sp. R1 TaxID=2944934 RepID=UPI0035A8AA29
MEDLFPSRQGRPSVPASVIGSVLVLVLQALQGLSDRETAEALTFDLRWKPACGYGLTDTAFHPSTLTYWRRRRAASKNPHRNGSDRRSHRRNRCPAGQAPPGSGFKGS